MQLIRICITFVFILTIASTNLIDLHYKSNTTADSDLFLKSAIECMTVITNKCIPCGSLITLISTIIDAPHMSTLNKLSSDKNCYNFIIRSFQTEDWLIWSDIYIISLKIISELDSIFTILSRDLAWNPKALFFIIIYELERSNLNYVFKSVMSRNIYNVFLITKSGKNGLNVNTYNPFDNDACGRSFDKVINIRNCQEVDSVRTNYTYLQNQLRNCTIDILGIEDVPNFIYATNKEFSFIRNNIEGLEQYMISNIAKQENLTLNFILGDPKAPRGVILSNWTVTGSLGYLDNNTVDIAVGALFVLRNRMKLFDSIWGYNYAAFHVFTPAIGEVTWSKVYRSFSVTIWILVALSYCLVTIISIFSRRYFEKHIDKTCLPLKLWGYFFGNINAKIIHVKKLRMVTIVWIWFTFFIANFYNTAFYSLLTAKSIEKVTLFNKSLDSLPFKPCISEDNRIFFKYRFNETLPGELNDMCKDTDDALDTVANSHEFYGLEKGYAYEIREFKYLNEEGERKLDTYRYTHFIMFAIYTRRGFPFKENFRRYALYHIEAGLLKHHKTKIYHRYNIHNKLFSINFKTFTFSDFRIHFGVLFLGYFISFIRFIIEINTKHKSHKKYKNNKNTRNLQNRYHFRY